MYILEINHGGGELHRYFLLPGEKYTIGRKECRLPLPNTEPSISRHHATLVMSEVTRSEVHNLQMNRQLCMQDFSKYGTHINNERIGRDNSRFVYPDDDIRFGIRVTARLISMTLCLVIPLTMPSTSRDRVIACAQEVGAVVLEGHSVPRAEFYEKHINCSGFLCVVDDKFTMCDTVLQALAHGYTLVSVSYIPSLLSALRQSDSLMPSEFPRLQYPRPLSPVLRAVSYRPPTPTFFDVAGFLSMRKPQPSTVLSGYTVILATEDMQKRYSSVLSTCGATVVEADARHPWKDDEVSPEGIVLLSEGEFKKLDDVVSTKQEWRSNGRADASSSPGQLIMAMYAKGRAFVSEVSVQLAIYRADAKELERHCTTHRLQRPLEEVLSDHEAMTAAAVPPTVNGNGSLDDKRSTPHEERVASSTTKVSSTSISPLTSGLVNSRGSATETRHTGATAIISSVSSIHMQETSPDSKCLGTDGRSHGIASVERSQSPEAYIISPPTVVRATPRSNGSPSSLSSSQMRGDSALRNGELLPTALNTANGASPAHEKPPACEYPDLETPSERNFSNYRSALTAEPGALPTPVSRLPAHASITDPGAAFSSSSAATRVATVPKTDYMASNGSIASHSQDSRLPRKNTHTTCASNGSAGLAKPVSHVSEAWKLTEPPVGSSISGSQPMRGDSRVTPTSRAPGEVIQAAGSDGDVSRQHPRVHGRAPRENDISSARRPVVLHPASLVSTPRRTVQPVRINKPAGETERPDRAPAQSRPLSKTTGQFTALNRSNSGVSVVSGTGGTPMTGRGSGGSTSGAQAEGPGAIPSYKRTPKRNASYARHDSLASGVQSVKTEEGSRVPQESRSVPRRRSSRNGAMGYSASPLPREASRKSRTSNLYIYHSARRHRSGSDPPTATELAAGAIPGLRAPSTPGVSLGPSTPSSEGFQRDAQLGQRCARFLEGFLETFLTGSERCTRLMHRQGYLDAHSKRFMEDGVQRIVDFLRVIQETEYDIPPMCSTEDSRRLCYEVRQKSTYILRRIRAAYEDVRAEIPPAIMDARDALGSRPTSPRRHLRSTTSSTSVERHGRRVS